MPKQLDLFTPDMPEAFYQYYLKHGKCKHCRSALRHKLHAFNHWKKYHRGSVKVVVTITYDDPYLR